MADSRTRSRTSTQRLRASRRFPTALPSFSKSGDSALFLTPRRWRCSARSSRSGAPARARSLLLLQHPPVITLGVKGDGGRSNVVGGRPRLRRSASRFGDRPGRRRDVPRPWTVRRISDPRSEPDRRRAPVRPRSRRSDDSRLRRLRNHSGTRRGLTGTWVGGEDRRHRRSDFALDHQPRLRFQRCTNLDHFHLIVPCGIGERGVTSLTKLTGKAVPIQEAEHALHVTLVRCSNVTRLSRPPMQGKACLGASATPRPATASPLPARCAT